MYILFIDTSTFLNSILLTYNTEYIYHTNKPYLKHNIFELLKPITIKYINKIVINNGPGPQMRIMTGNIIADIIALSLNIPIIKINILDAMAFYTKLTDISIMATKRKGYNAKYHNQKRISEISLDYISEPTTNKIYSMSQCIEYYYKNNY